MQLINGPPGATYYLLTLCKICFLAFLACYLNTWKLSTQNGSMMAASQRANDEKRFLSVQRVKETSERKQEVVSRQLSHTNTSTSPVRHGIIIVPMQKKQRTACFIAFQVAIVISVITDKTAINFRSGALLSTINSPQR